MYISCLYINEQGTQQSYMDIRLQKYDPNSFLYENMVHSIYQPIKFACKSIDKVKYPKLDLVEYVPKLERLRDHLKKGKMIRGFDLPTSLQYEILEERLRASKEVNFLRNCR